MSDEIKAVDQRFLESLNRHGCSFQYSVIKKLEDLWDQEQSPWLPEPAEFPVSVQGRDVHIDFIMRLVRDRCGHTITPEKTQCYMVAECKRTDPALKNWCFSRAPYVSRDRRSNRLILEHSRLERPDGAHREHRSDGAYFRWQDDAYHIALEVKSEQKGDGSGSGRTAINEAVTQVCRGVNGLVEHLHKRMVHRNLAVHPSALIVPVIFTTAKLFTTEIDLSSADLATGNVDTSEAQLKDKPWVRFQYPVSLGLKHSFGTPGEHSELRDVLVHEHLRSVLIVNAASVEGFIHHYLDGMDNIRGQLPEVQ